MDIKLWKKKAKQLQNEVHVLFLASKDPRVPWYAKILALIIIAYALSPIDLIPDFIPVIGYLDDLVLIPAGIIFLMKIIPKEVMAGYREKVRSQQKITKRIGWIAGSVIVAIWLLIIYFCLRLILKTVLNRTL
jgi:uncharacterized membrane protein YkvA (DUF1232 family)